MKRKTDVAAAAAARDRAQRIAALWEKPTLSDPEIAEAIGLAFSTWQAHKSRGDHPPLFYIGRRVFARTADVRAWLDRKAQAAAAA